jgi:LPS export ABC transporter protein LptC
MDFRNTLNIVFAAALLAVAGYYWGFKTSNKPLTGEENLSTDYHITGLKLIETNKQGQIWRQLRAKEFKHFDKPTESAEIIAPVATFYDNGQPAWLIYAQKGLSSQQNSELFLSGGVYAIRQNPDDLPISFNTESLFIWPKQNKLEANSAVRVNSTRGYLTSNHLLATLKTGEIRLSNEVIGYYAPSSR